MSTRREIPADAPAFDPGRSDYPLGGEKTGPIWRAAWWLMRDMGEHSGAAVVEHIRREIPDAHPETVRLILRRAAVAGILESEIRQVQGKRGSRGMAHYRIKR